MAFERDMASAMHSWVDRLPKAIVDLFSSASFLAASLHWASFSNLQASSRSLCKAISDTVGKALRSKGAYNNNYKNKNKNTNNNSKNNNKFNSKIESEFYCTGSSIGTFGLEFLCKRLIILGATVFMT